MSKKIFSQIGIGLVLLAVFFRTAGETNSLFIDKENSSGNTFSAGSLDFSLRDGDGDLLTSPFFASSDVDSLYSETKNFKIKKDGSLDFIYQGETVKTGGDDVFCAVLNLEARREGVLQYDSDLLSFTFTPQTISSFGEDNWEFTITADEGFIYGGYTCGFNFVFKGWQIGSDGSWGLTDEESVGNNLIDREEELFPLDLELPEDETPPTMNLSLPQEGKTRWNGQNLVENGDFESGMNGWTAGGSGDHHLVSEGYDGGNMFALGWQSAAPVADTNDWLTQAVNLPQNLTSTLSFWWRVISEDIVDFDWFRGWIEDLTGGYTNEDIILTGSGNIVDLSGWDGDSDWRQITYPLTKYGGRNIKIWFETINSVDSSKRTWAYIDAVKISTVDERITEETPINFEIHDGAGLGAPDGQYSVDGSPEETVDIFTTPTPLPAGDKNIAYYAEDLAGNVSATREADLVVLPQIVINAMMPDPDGDDTGSVGNPLDGEWVELFNNGSVDVDINGWYLYDKNIGSNIVISTTNSDSNGDLNDGGETVVPVKGKLKVYCNGDTTFSLNNTGGDEISLYDGDRDGGGQLIDQFAYQNDVEKDEVWQRDPDGLGSWKLVKPELSAHIVSRYTEANKILLTVYNIPAGYAGTIADLITYEIIYKVGGTDKGIAGKILPSTVINNKTDREFYLGVCSSGGVCVPDTVLGTEVTLTLKKGTTTVINSKEFNI